MENVDNGAGNQPAADTTAVPLEEELGAIFDKVNTPEPAGNAGEAQPDAGQAVPADAAADAGKARDPITGKFAKATESVTAKPDAQTKPDGAKADAAATPGKDSDQAKAAGSELPPSSWSVEARSLWATAPAALKEAVIKREQEVEQGFRQIGDQVKPLIAVGRILEPQAQALNVNYGSVEQAVTLWTQMDEFARRDVEGFIKWYAGARGVDLAKLAGGQGGQQQQQLSPSDPQYTALSGQVQQLSTVVQNQLAQAEQARVADYMAQVARFQADPKNLYFPNVRDDMAALITAGLATTIEEAYEQAIWRHPEIRPKLLAAQSGAAEEARRAEAARKAAEATRVNSQNLSSVGSVSGTTPMSRDDELAATYDRVNAA